MLEVVAEAPPQVLLAEDDDVVQAHATDAPDHPLGEGVLPGASRGSEHFFDAHALHSRSKGLAVHPVAIPDQVAWRRLPWKCLGDLLGRSLGGRVLRHVEVNDPAPRVREHRPPGRTQAVAHPRWHNPPAHLRVRREHLKTEADIARYWEACLEEGRDDPAFITTALGNVARARGMSQLARKTGLTREGLYKALSPGGSPELVP